MVTIPFPAGADLNLVTTSNPSRQGQVTVLDVVTSDLKMVVQFVDGERELDPTDTGWTGVRCIQIHDPVTGFFCGVDDVDAPVAIKVDGLSPHFIDVEASEVIVEPALRQASVLEGASNRRGGRAGEERADGAKSGGATSRWKIASNP